MRHSRNLNDDLPHGAHVGAAAYPLHDGVAVVRIAAFEQYLAQGVSVQENGIVQVRSFRPNLWNQNGKSTSVD